MVRREGSFAPASLGYRVVSTKRVTRRLGMVAVDSGTICIVDPCYAQFVAEQISRDAIQNRKRRRRDPPKGILFGPKARLKMPSHVNGSGLEYGLIHATQWGDGFYPIYGEFNEVVYRGGRKRRHIARIVIDLERAACPRRQKR